MAATAFAAQSPFAQGKPPGPAPMGHSPMTPVAPAPPPASQVKTVFMDQPAAAPPPAQPPPPQMMAPPPAMTPPPPAAMPPHVMVPAAPVPAMPQPMGYSPMQPSPGSTAIVTAQAPLAGGLQIVLIVFGALLLAAFVTPVATKPETKFWWDGLTDLKAAYKLMPIFMAAGGLLGVLLGAIPLPATGRAVAATALGAIPLLYAPLAVNPEAEWQYIANGVGAILVPAGLLLRSSRPGNVLGGVLATLGALAVLAVWLVPVHDKIPLQAAFDVLGSEMPTKLKVALFMPVLYVLFAVLALGVWLPSAGAAKAFAWIWILGAIIVHFAILIGVGDIADMVDRSPNISLFAGLEFIARAEQSRDLAAAEALMLTPSGVIASAYSAFAGYGLATLLGKSGR